MGAPAWYPIAPVPPFRCAELAGSPAINQFGKGRSDGTDVHVVDGRGRTVRVFTTDTHAMLGRRRTAARRYADELNLAAESAAA